LFIGAIRLWYSITNIVSFTMKYNLLGKTGVLVSELGRYPDAV
jgi:hypothetical protein